MKKIASVICLFVFALGVHAQASSNVPESVSELKAKIVKLEAQVEDAVKVIRAVRAENRALKREIRKLKKTALQANVNVENKTSANVAVEKDKALPEISTLPKVEKIEQEEKSQETKDSSFWDSILPF